MSKKSKAKIKQKSGDTAKQNLQSSQKAQSSKAVQTQLPSVAKMQQEASEASPSQNLAIDPIDKRK